MVNKPKIKALSLKYGFSLNSKSELETIQKRLSTQNTEESRIELSVIYVYYRQRLPIEISKQYLNLGPKDKMEDNEILSNACIKHQKELLKNCKWEINTKHLIDGLEYPCRIVYGSSICKCGITGFQWNTPNMIEYNGTYWLQKVIRPMISIKSEPILTMRDEFIIMRRNVRLCRKEDVDPRWIHSRVKDKRINAYQLYYDIYWEWEHMEDEIKPRMVDEWIKYMETTGCANHRDLVESVHIMLSNRKEGIDFRYGMTLVKGAYKCENKPSKK